jgi:hypothetical protein
MAISSGINLFLKGQMEYAIISFSVGERIYSWLFHSSEHEIILMHPGETDETE